MPVHADRLSGVQQFKEGVRPAFSAGGHRVRPVRVFRQRMVIDTSGDNEYARR